MMRSSSIVFVTVLLFSVKTVFSVSLYKTGQQETNLIPENETDPPVIEDNESNFYRVLGQGFYSGNNVNGSDYDYGVCKRTGFKYQNKTAVVKLMLFFTLTSLEEVKKLGFDPETYSAVVVDTLNRRYYSKIRCPKIEVKLSKVLVSKNEEDETFLKLKWDNRGGCSVDTAIGAWGDFVYNWAKETKSDINAAYFFTQCVGGGVAYTGGICSAKYRVGYGLVQNPSESRVIVHEIGHLLGSDHDAEGSSKECPQVGHIMGGNDFDTFSECSIKAFVKKFESGSASCLYEGQK